MVNLTHEITTVFDLQSKEMSEYLNLSFDLLEEERPIQVKVMASNGVSSYLVTKEGTMSDGGIAKYEVGPLTMGAEIPLPRGTWEITIITEDGIIRSDQIEIADRSQKQLEGEVPLYNEETGVISNIPVPCKLTLYDANSEIRSTGEYQEETYTLQGEGALVIEKDAITYLLTP